MKCSVLSTSMNKKESCLTSKQLKKITELHNKENTAGKLPTSVTKPKLLKNLKEALDIKDEQHLSKFNFIKKDKLLYYTLKNLLYKKRLSYRKNGWLTNTDIDSVMTQYSLKYNFSYTGAIPSDYFTHHPFKRSYPSYIIFNLDPSHKPGSHWVSMIIHEDNTAEYFDSNGMKPNRYISNFLKNINCTLKWYNKETLQNKDGLCGVYAIYFLIKKAQENCVCLNPGQADEKIMSAKKDYFY